MTAASTAVHPGPAAAAPSYAWYVAGLLSLAHLVSFVDRFVMSLVLAPIKAQMHLSDFQLGAVQGLGFVILYSLVGVPIGRLADVASRRWLIAAGMLIWSLATAGCAFAQTYPQLFACRIMVGFGEAALVPAAMSLLAGYFGRMGVSRPVALFTMGATLGKTVALVSGAWLIATMTPLGGITLGWLGHFRPWQGVFLAASLPGLILVPLMLTVGDPPRARSLSPSEETFGAVVRHMGRHAGAYGSHIAAACAAILLVQVFGVWGPSFFSRAHHLTVPQSGYLVGTTALACSPLGALFGGWVTHLLLKRGQAAAPLLVIGAGMALAIPLALLLRAAPDVVSATIAYGLLLFTLSSTSGPCLTGIQLLTPDPQRGAATSIYMCIMTVLSVGLGPAVVGALSDAFFGGDKGLTNALTVTAVGVGLIGLVSAMAGRKAFSKAARE
jgi:MFS family permease